MFSFWTLTVMLATVATILVFVMIKAAIKREDDQAIGLIALVVIMVGVVTAGAMADAVDRLEFQLQKNQIHIEPYPDPLFNKGAPPHEVDPPWPDLGDPQPNPFAPLDNEGGGGDVDWRIQQGLRADVV